MTGKNIKLFSLGLSLCFFSSPAMGTAGGQESLSQACKNAVESLSDKKNTDSPRPEKAAAWNENNILELAVLAESSQQRADQLFSAHGRAQYSHISNKLKYITDKLLQNKNWTAPDLQFHRDQIQGLDQKLTEYEFMDLNPAPSAVSLTPWSAALESPSLLQADTPYAVQFPDGVFYIVIFNQKVIDRFFNVNNPLYDESAAKKLLKTIQKGYVSQKHSSGIKSLYQNKNSVYNDLLEVKTLGRLTGRIRLGGFRRDSYIYLFHYVEDSDHSKIRTRFISQLLNIYKKIKATGENQDLLGQKKL